MRWFRVCLITFLNLKGNWGSNQERFFHELVQHSRQGARKPGGGAAGYQAAQEGIKEQLFCYNLGR